MLLCKYSLFISIIFSLICFAYADDYSIECLQKSFKTKVSHKGQPLGFTNNILEVNKDKCVLEIKSEKMKYLKKRWLIDVCRAPIHIKEGTGAVDVHRKKIRCSSRMRNEKDSFCSSFYDLRQVIQDYGLIFADGEKEDLNSDHGKINCAYGLINKYLDEEKIFSRHSPKKVVDEVKIIKMPETSNISTEEAVTQ